MNEDAVFIRPPPLPAEGNYEFTNGKWYEFVDGKYVPAAGVIAEESIYFMWFEYLRRSEKYKVACQNNGKGMEKLFADFGNVHEYEFLDWWEQKGLELFAERGSSSELGFMNLDDIASQEEAIESGELKLVAIPTNMNKTAIRSKLSELLKELEVKPTTESTALYPLTNSKIDARSLAKCLMAYDLSQEGKQNVFIGGYIEFVDENLADESFLEDLQDDARKYHIYVDNEELREKFLEKDAELEKKIRQAEIKIEKRLIREGRLKSTEDECRDVDLDEWNELLEKELGLLIRKTGFEVKNPKTNKMVDSGSAT